MGNRYIRQTTYGQIQKEGQEQLKNARVAVVGLGAVGSRAADWLARAGIGHMRLVDRDTVYMSNLQRMNLYTEEDARREVPKAAAAVKRLAAVNSEIELEAVNEDVNNRSVDQILSGIDLVIDGTDNSETKFLLGEACRQGRIPWIYSMAVGSFGKTQNFLPEDTWPCLRCTMDYDGMKDSPSCLTEGVLSSTTAMVASSVVCEAVKILTNSEDVRREMLYIDDWHNIVRKLMLAKNPECPVCVYKQYSYYGRESGMQAAALCGRDSVQIIPVEESRQDFDAVAFRLEKYGTVRINAFTLDFEDGVVGIKLFKNGRAMIKNVTDINRAKSIYNRYVGDISEEGRRKI